MCDSDKKLPALSIAGLTHLGGSVKKVSSSPGRILEMRHAQGTCEAEYRKGLLSLRSDELTN
jgi:hypothetical protein